MASKVERGDMSGRRDALPEALDTFDPSEYNEIKLNGDEAAKLQSEAFNWHANKRNKPVAIRANGFVYLCVIDDDAEIHCYAKEPTRNIHEKGERYDNGNSRGSHRLSEKYRSQQVSDIVGGRPGRDRRKSDGTTADDGRSLYPERESDRGRGQHDAFVPRGRKKIVRAKLDEDGSGHGVKYYSDGTSERFALPEDASYGLLAAVGEGGQEHLNPKRIHKQKRAYTCLCIRYNRPPAHVQDVACFSLF